MSFDNSFDYQDLIFDREGPDPRDDPYYGAERNGDDERHDEWYYDQIDMQREQEETYRVFRNRRILVASIFKMEYQDRKLDWYFN